MKEVPDDILENFQWLQAPDPAWGWALWIGLFLVLTVLAAITWRILRKNRSKLFGTGPSPHHTALRALDALHERISEEDQFAFILEVSRIVRSYIQARFGVRAPHRSTEEFLQEARDGDQLLSGHQDLLAAFLTQCDLVKFAERHVVRSQMQTLLDDARGFVEATIPAETPEKAVTGKP